VLPPEFWQGVAEFNAQEFYACHDTLEALWMEATEPPKRFYQGILQIAVACYHLENHNWRGAAILLGEGTNRLRSYPLDYENVNVEQILVQAGELLAAVQQIQPEQVADLVQQLSQSGNPLTWPQIATIAPFETSDHISPSRDV